MLLGILYRLFESSLLAKWDIEELDSIFLSELMPHTKEFFEILLWGSIETRSKDWDPEPCSKLRGHHHTHIVAIGTLLSPLGRMLDSLDPREKIPDIIGSLDIGNPLDLTDLHEGFIALIVL